MTSVMQHASLPINGQQQEAAISNMPAAQTMPAPGFGTTSNQSLLAPPVPAQIDNSNAISLVRTAAGLGDIRGHYQQTDINSSLPNEDWNALTYFTAENDIDSVTKLILSGAQTDKCGSKSALIGTGHTPLHVAGRYGSVDCMEHLIRGRVRRARRDFGSDMEVQMEVEMQLTHSENIGCDINSKDR